MYSNREYFDYKELGKKIKLARKKLRYTQAKVAKLTDLSTTYISEIERGVKHPLLPVVIDLANCLEIDALQLLYPWLHTTMDYQESLLNNCIRMLLPEHRILISTILDMMIEECIKMESSI